MAGKPTIRSSINQVLPYQKEHRFRMTEKQKQALTRVSEVVLGVIAVAGVATIAIVAPNALQVISKISRIKSKGCGKKEAPKKITRSFYYLRDRGFIEIIPEGKEFIVKLTRKGEEKILRMSLDALEIKHDKKWGGYWWVTVADVPVEERYKAHLLRSKLKVLGFYALQRTVWVYPYDPRDEVDFLASCYGVDKYLTLMRADQLDPADEKVLKKHFKKIGLI